MKELLEKAVILVEEITAKNIKLNDLIDKNKSLLEKNKEKEIVLKEKEVELNSREEKIKYIEDVEAVKVSNSEKAKEIKKDLSELNIQRNAFVGYQEQIKNEHKAKIDSLESSIKAANDKEEKYEKALGDLKEQEKKLKETVLKEIANKIK